MQDVIEPYRVRSYAEREGGQLYLTQRLQEVEAERDAALARAERAEQELAQIHLSGVTAWITAQRDEARAEAAGCREREKSAAVRLAALKTELTALLARV